MRLRKGRVIGCMDLRVALPRLGMARRLVRWFPVGLVIVNEVIGTSHLRYYDVNYSMVGQLKQISFGVLNTLEYE
jgi:hypothetical protein